MKQLLKSFGVQNALPFLLITSCFALWGFANDITNPMVKSFSKIFNMSVTEGALVQVAFYGGYFAMAFPAAMFIYKHSYKAGIMLGLLLYGIGALLFIPAKETGMYYPFLMAYFILTCGLSFLETSANPYILSMGDDATATRRLNLAQAFNPIGSLLGMYVAMNFIQAKLNPMDSNGRQALSPDAFESLKQSDLAILVAPYVVIGLVVLTMCLIIKAVKMPVAASPAKPMKFVEMIKRLLSNEKYREGVIAQFFYMGAQIMCWTFIIQYGTRLFMNSGESEAHSEVLSQSFNIAAMVLFCSSRFIFTFLMKYFKPGKLLMTAAILGALLIIGVITNDSFVGLYCLVGVSACMSLMFPTIYGIALSGMKEDAKFGAAGLIMAILGGSIMPPLQAMIIDVKHDIMGLPAVNVSYVICFVCFLVVARYGYKSYKQFK